MVAAPARCSLEYDLVNAPTARAGRGRGARVWPTAGGPAWDRAPWRSTVGPWLVRMWSVGVRRAPGGGAHTLLVLLPVYGTVHGAPWWWCAWLSV